MEDWEGGGRRNGATTGKAAAEGMEANDDNALVIRICKMPELHGAIGAPT